MSSTESMGLGKSLPGVPSITTWPFDRLLGGWHSLVQGLASLKLTLVLFALSFFLIIVGTLAQWDKNMWQVLSDYFRAYVAWIDLQLFLPPSFFPRAPRIPGGFFFPGGKTLGILLMINLVAAHSTRFHVVAKGRRRVQGWLCMAVGMVLTLLVILTSQGQGGIQGKPLITYDSYWQLLRLSSVLAFAYSLYTTFRIRRERRAQFWVSVMGTALSAAICVVLLVWGGAHRLSDSSMRILWQMGQCLVPAVTVLVAGILLFRQRGGVVAIHLGVALLMIGELVVGLFAVEEQVTLVEGSSTNYALETHQAELAVIDRAPQDHDVVTAVPFSRLRPGETLSDPRLPFDLELVEYFRNSSLTPATDQEPSRATRGLGQKFTAVPQRSSGGADPNQLADIASAYIRVLPKDGSQGDIYLFSQDPRIELRPEPIVANGHTYEMTLRAKRNYKPYTVELLDVRKEDYLGTEQPRDYSSFVNITNARGEQELSNYRIWMNNPLRYAGETFYQSSYGRVPSGEYSTLSVVTNEGWMIPYLACVFVLLGMLFHFGTTLSRFLGRVRPIERTVGGWRLPLVVMAVFASLMLLAARERPPEASQWQLSVFSQLPVIYEGRIQPIDTLARNSLLIVSNKQSLRALRGDESKSEAASGPRQPALKWLLDVASGSPDARKQRVIRIENLEVQNLLGVERRHGFLYSLEEIAAGLPALEAAVQKAYELQRTDPTRLTLEQRKVVELAERLQALKKLQIAFQPTPFPPLPTEKEAAEDPDGSQKRLELVAGMAQEAVRRAAESKQNGIPLVVPGDKKDDWLPFGSAVDRAYVGRMMMGTQPTFPVVAWSRILDAYADQSHHDFDRAVASYRKYLEKQPSGVDFAKVDFEAFFNRFQPFLWARWSYLVAFVLIAISWLRWHGPLQRVAFWWIVATLALHTFALGARIYISGRPPVTNLYTSAVFIGWAMVVLGLLFEVVFRQGLGQVISAICGFATLLIAHYLAGDGDTLKVLQAVLDTQFWLATHVVCITLGYSTTFLAGAFGTAYILGRYVGVAWTEQRDEALGNMIYGTVCFALFFSFLGTLLGGLWADDSWGRFWGWDPKENGALMIVLWNAMVLHARWDKMIRIRGMAVMAVLGNIVTAWSWFGVNELGIGLHSYGFTEGVLPALGGFALTQLMIAVRGMMAPRTAGSPGTHPGLPA